jgi:MarR family transcriptional regulator, organic hydroperoxide resistance regulator
VADIRNKSNATPPTEKVGRLADALNAIYRRMDLYQDELQTSPKEQLFLLAVEDAGAVRVKDLAARVRLPLSTVSWTADRMVEKGYLKRKPDPRDRRAVLLEPARKGRAAIARHHELFRTIAGLAYTQLGENEFDRILKLIESLSQAV